MRKLSTMFVGVVLLVSLLSLVACGSNVVSEYMAEPNEKECMSFQGISFMLPEDAEYLIGESGVAIVVQGVSMMILNPMAWNEMPTDNFLDSIQAIMFEAVLTDAHRAADAVTFMMDDEGWIYPTIGSVYRTTVRQRTHTGTSFMFFGNEQTVIMMNHFPLNSPDEAIGIIFEIAQSIRFE